MKLKLFQQLKNASKWVFKEMENFGKGIADAEERLYFDETPHEPIKWVSHARSFAKAVSWRFFGNLISFLIIYGLTHNGKLALAASGIELIVKIVLYYYHERFWNKISWGRE
jgi:uncharacterized membrane protein